MMIFDSLHNQLLEKVVLPIGDKVEGGEFMRWFQRYRKEQWLNHEQLMGLQNRRLRNLLDFARRNVPFYADVPAKLENSIDDIGRFPIITKTIINENLGQLLTMPKEKLLSESSSGSSGIQGVVYMDRSSQASQRAMQLLWFEWSGYKIGDSVLQTGMTTKRGIIKAAKDLFLNTQYISAFKLDPNQIEDLLKQLRHRPRKYLFGYASSLFVLAETAIELGLDNIRFEAAVSWGDKLFPHYRTKIKQAFGCETMDTYGCTEGAMVAAQCNEGKYHLSVNQCYVEIVDEFGNRIPPGEMGRVIVTRLDNFSMPLIRYDLGDLAELAPGIEKQCGCQRWSPLLRRIVGRNTDIVKTRSGKNMIVHFFTAIFEHIPEIKQFKVIQRTLDEIEIHYIAGSGFEKTVLERIEKMIHDHLDEKFPISWLETADISATKSGKPEIIKSFLDHGLNITNEGDNSAIGDVT